MRRPQLPKVQYMNDEDIEMMDEHAVIVVVTHDNTRMWLLNDVSEHPFMTVIRHEPPHVHVRSAQAHHGHASEIGEIPYFVDIASALEGATTIVLIGHGTGKANAAERFQTYVREHSKDVAAKISGLERVNIPALHDGEIVADARERWMVSKEERIASLDSD
jgi:hypothetical protein